MTYVIFGFVLVMLTVLMVLGFRWSKRPEMPDDMRRADEAEAGDPYDAQKTTDRASDVLTWFPRP